jgi:hypothetical protein
MSSISFNIARAAHLDNERGLIHRRPLRLHVKQPCVVHPFGGPPVDALLEDVSRRGFRVSSNALLLVGSEVVLDVPGLGQIGAQIRWALGSEAGGIFRSRIDDDMFTRWLGDRRNDASSPE